VAAPAPAAPATKPAGPAAAAPAAKPAAPAAKPAAKAPAPEPKNAASAQAIALDPAAASSPTVSRSLSAVEGSLFEIPFEGTGWTYLGEESNKAGIAYDSRRLTASSLVFVLNPQKAGDYLLRFQRQDSLRGLSYEELVAVAVAPRASPGAAAMGATSSAASGASGASAPIAPNASSSAVAPSGPAAQPGAVPATAPSGAAATLPSTPNIAAAPKPAAVPAAASAGASGAAPSAVATSTSPTAPSAAPPVLPASALATPEAALVQARAELAAGHAQEALAALDRLMALAPAGMDEAFMLYARALESNGPQKDIKRAYAYYIKVRDEYPESPFWEDASARASYIERHYFDIR
jgi:hypothetical protein